MSKLGSSVIRYNQCRKETLLTPHFFYKVGELIFVCNSMFTDKSLYFLYTLHPSVPQRVYCYCFNITEFVFLIHTSKYSELLMASYNASEYAPQEPDGIVLVWNMKFKKTVPEHIFHCQVEIFACWS